MFRLGGAEKKLTATGQPPSQYLHGKFDGSPIAGKQKKKKKIKRLKKT